MNQDYYIQLIHKGLSGDILPKEQQELESWKKQSPDNELISEQVRKSWEAGGRFKSQPDIDLEADFKSLQGKLHQGAEVKTLPKRPRWWATAAAFLLLLAAGFVVRNYVIGGHQLKRLITEAGETSSVKLTDGTTVYLNENSTLSYPAEFSSSERLVRLDGEAFFEVAKDSEKPFIIKGSKGEVKVLGTSFNVRDRKLGKDMAVSVRSGKVLLSSFSGQVILEKNEKGTIENGLVSKTSDKNLNDLAWHSKKINFSADPLSEVITSLEQLYSVDIQLTDKNLSTCPFSGNFEFSNLEETLNTIASVFDMNIEKISDRRFNLKGGKCE